MSKKVSILLTSSIDTSNCILTSRSDIETRKNDYINTIDKYLKFTQFDIIFIDNSNYDLSFIREKFCEQLDRIEIISYNGNNYDRELGKGYGELEIIHHCISNSDKLKNQSHIIKSTGRYFISNLEYLIKNIDINQYNFVGFLTKDILHTFFLCINVEYYKDNYMADLLLHNPINDSKGYYLEHLFYKIYSETDKKLNLDQLKVDGISATFDVDINILI